MITPNKDFLANVLNNCLPTGNCKIVFGMNWSENNCSDAYIMRLINKQIKFVVTAERDNSSKLRLVCTLRTGGKRGCNFFGDDVLYYLGAKSFSYNQTENEFFNKTRTFVCDCYNAWLNPFTVFADDLR